MTGKGLDRKIFLSLSVAAIHERYSLAMQGEVDFSQQRVSGERFL